MRRILFLMFVVLVVLVGPAYATHKTTITVSCVSDYDVALRKIIPNFNRKYPNINVTLIPHDSGFDNRDFLYNAGPDILILQGRPLTGDPLVNLKAFPFWAGRYRKLIAPYAWTRALDEKNRLLAIPLNITPYCSYWRKDIFREAGVDFNSIKTVKDLYIAAGKISKDSDGDGKIDRWFMPYAGQISYMILSSSSRPLVRKIGGRLVLDDKRIRTALNWSRKFHQSGYDIGEKALFASGYRFYQNGEVAYESWPPFFTDYISNYYQTDQWRAAPWPALNPNEKPMAGACWREIYLAIPQRVKHQWEAWKFVEYVCLNKQSQISIYQSEGTSGLPAYMPCWNLPVFEENDPLFGGQRVIKLWFKTAKSIPAFQESYVSYLAFYTVLHYEKRVTCDGMSIDEVIDEIRQKLDKENRQLNKQ